MTAPTPAATRVGIAVSLALRAGDRAGAELLFADATTIGEVLDVNQVVTSLAPGHRYGDLTDETLRRLLLAEAATS